MVFFLAVVTGIFHVIKSDNTEWKPNREPKAWCMTENLNMYEW